MKNFAFVLRSIGPKSYRDSGGAMPIRVDTRSSSAPTVSATQAPNDMPPAHIGAPGYCACMKSSAARVSSISPGPLLKRPALAPAPRKLKRSAAQPMRLNALATWYTTLVCIVPPNSVCGCANTAAARSPSGRPRLTRPSRPMLPAAAGSSSNASRRPAGPGISRSGMASPVDEIAHEHGERIRPGNRSQMARALEHDGASVRDEPDIFGRAVDRHDVVERAIAGDDERRRSDARAIGSDVVRRNQLRPRGHSGQRHRGAQQHTERAHREPPPGAPIGDGGTDFRTETPRRFRDEQGPEDPRRAQVEFVPAPETQSRPRRRCEHQGVTATGMPRREADRNEPPERYAADRGAVDPRLVERRRDLLRIAVQIAGAKGERHYAEVGGQRIDGRAHILPAALKAGNQHERRPASAVDYLHHM